MKRLKSSYNIQLNSNSIPQFDEHPLDGIHRSEEPVSKITRKFWAGSPMEIVPMKYDYE